MAQPIRRMRTATAAARATSAAPKVSKERSSGYVRTSASDRQGAYFEEEKQLDVLEETFTSDDPPAYVKVGGGLTISLGNYEMLRIDCSVSLPCHRSRIDEAMDAASNIVAERVAEEETNWLGEGNERMRNKGKGK